MFGTYKLWGDEMKINNINVQNEGYVHCKSVFYSAHDSLSNCSRYTFSPGINKMIGEIDSGNWAISYLLSMYKHMPKDFTLFENPQIFVNDKSVSLNEFSETSCYMDKLYPLFSDSKSVKKLVVDGLKHSKSKYSTEDIMDMFCLDSERFERPLNQAGNEIFRAMAAIGISYGKEIFCFPWMSRKRFDYYNKNLIHALSVLEKLKKIVILPIGMSTSIPQ